MLVVASVESGAAPGANYPGRNSRRVGTRRQPDARGQSPGDGAWTVAKSSKRVESGVESWRYGVGIIRQGPLPVEPPVDSWDVGIGVQVLTDRRGREMLHLDEGWTVEGALA